MNFLVSFSGGKTSAFMSRFVQLHRHGHKDRTLYVFANTSKEKEETYTFIDRCDKEWGLNIVWIEAVINDNKGEGTSYKVVDYNSADRTGKVYELMIKKYGLPNIVFPHCSRELKVTPIQKFAKDYFGDEPYKTLIGIRKDESHRINLNKIKEGKYAYPLVDCGIDKRFIEQWWSEQSFNLHIKSYEGNCDFCFKKSYKKLRMLAKEEPEKLLWWKEMEKKYGEGMFTFFRGNISAQNLAEDAEKDISLFDDMIEDQESVCMCLHH